MDTYKKKCSFLLPSYNDNELLLETLRSIDNEGIHILIVDDGSDVSIDSIVDVNQFSCDILILRLEENKGIICALNTGIDYLMRNGFTYVFRIDSGDINIAGRVDSQLEFMVKEDLILVGGFVEYFNSDMSFIHKVPILSREISKQQCLRSCFIHPAVLLNISAINCSNLYSKDYLHAEDYELFLRLSSKFSRRIGNVERVVVRCLVRSSGISLSNRRVQVISALKSQLKYFNPMNANSYLGVIKSIFLLIVPYKQVQKLKAILR